MRCGVKRWCRSMFVQLVQLRGETTLTCHFPFWQCFDFKFLLHLAPGCQILNTVHRTGAVRVETLVVWFWRYFTLKFWEVPLNSHFFPSIFYESSLIFALEARSSFHLLTIDKRWKGAHSLEGACLLRVFLILLSFSGTLVFFHFLLFIQFSIQKPPSLSSGTKGDKFELFEFATFYFASDF